MSNIHHKAKICSAWNGNVVRRLSDSETDQYSVTVEITPTEPTNANYPFQGKGIIEHGEHGGVPVLISGHFPRESAFLVIDYHNEDPGTVHFGTCMLELSPEGDAMEGHFIAYSPVDSGLIHGLLSFSKPETGVSSTQ